MRIISGHYGGRRLAVSAGKSVRPTTDRVREALFSSLGNRVVGARVLDLFAGSGALGLECLSRGATRVTFVEKQQTAAAVLRKNIRHLTVDSQCDIFQTDAMTWLRHPIATTSRFHLIFLDPPYDSGFLEITLGILAEETLLEANGTIVAELPTMASVVVPPTLTVEKRKKYGNTQIVLLRATPITSRKGIDSAS